MYSRYIIPRLSAIYFLMRYTVAGLVGACIQVTADFIFVDVLHRHYMEGVVVGFFVTVFLLHKYWTFNERTSSHTKRQFGLYTFISLWSLLANVILMYMFVGMFGLWYVLAQVCTVVIVSGMSIAFNVLITFKTSSVNNG